MLSKVPRDGPNTVPSLGLPRQPSAETESAAGTACARTASLRTPQCETSHRNFHVSREASCFRTTYP